MVLALATYQQLERRDPAQALAKFQSGAQIQREIEYFKANIGNVKSVDDLIKNRRLMSFVLSVYGLDSEIDKLGRVKAVLNSDLTNINSLANKLNDRRFREMATDLQTQAKGLTVLQSAAKIADLTTKYVSAEYEKFLGKQDPAIREARYFAANIGKVKNVYEILSDTVLRKVVTKALGLPDQIVVMPIESQAQLLRTRLDLSQFQNAAAASATEAYANLQGDVSQLAFAQTVANSASKAARTAASRLQTIKDGYDGLAALQDPGGANAAEIPVHTAAIPELARQRGLAEAAQGSIGRTADALNRMFQLRDDAADPANAASLADYKIEFAELAQTIRDEVADGADYAFGGATQNLLDGSLAGPLTTTITSAGATVTLNSHDLSGFIAQIDAADAAFAAVADTSDTANLGATATALTTGGPQLGAVRDTIIADRASADAAIAGVATFTATIDTAALGTALTSITDADARAALIGTKLSEIAGVAEESAARLPTDDRSDLEASLVTLRAELDALIATPGAGADNLLDGASRDYALTGGQSLTVGGHDFTATIGAPVAAGSVSDAASAQALVDQIEDTLYGRVRAARDALAVDKAVVGQVTTGLDARGKLDEQFRQLAIDLPGIVDNSSVFKNLLQPDSTGLVTALKAQRGTTITVNSQPGFKAAVNDVVTAAVADLPGNLGTAGSGGGYDKLVAALTAAGDGADALDRDRRAVETALFDAKRRLAQSAAPDAKAASKPTAATQRFVLRYLALSDAAGAQSAGASDYRLALFGGGSSGGGGSGPANATGFFA